LCKYAVVLWSDLNSTRLPAQPPTRPMKVAFIHPDLGIGGAERLVIDACVEFMDAGHEVVMYTGYHDVARCFEETRNTDGTRAPWIRVHGAMIPRSIFGYFHALMANLSCLYCALVLLRNETNVHCVIVDQVSSPNALIRGFTNIAVLFYCHFPDMLLATATTKRASRLRAAYRAPLNFLEQITTGMAHKVVVNSKFTEDIFAKTFKMLYRLGIHPAVVYPAAALDTFFSQTEFDASTSDVVTFLSINRFEKKKNLALALRAYALYLQEKKPGVRTRLVLAGGYDKRLAENVSYFSFLKKEASAIPLSNNDSIVFAPSVTSLEKKKLLNTCALVLYTPPGEHFGIVPIEAMAACKPVIACDTGGPKESIVHGVTGLLCAPDPKEWAGAMLHITHDLSVARRMGTLARQHVEWKFSRRKFGEKMMAAAGDALVEAARVNRKRNQSVVSCLNFALFAAFVFVNAKAYSFALAMLRRVDAAVR
jgi:alpha-1,3/alpha-1,6-mannosyltransferase